jgi:hypothetical protein
MYPREFRDKLTQGFKNIRKQGYFARQNFWCCQSCGCAAVPPEYTHRYIFYHNQDAERINKDLGVYLAWGGNGEEIQKAFLEADLAVKWDGTNDARIYVSAPPVETVVTDDEEYAHQIEALMNTMH